MLAAYTGSRSDRYFSAFNVTSLLTLLAALGFIAMGQLVVIMTGGIDLSVGPLAGFLVVIASFFVNDGKSVPTMILGFALMLGAAITSGLIAGCLVRFAGFTAVAATLTLYIALQGLSLLLRPFQGGYINSGVTDALQTTVGAVPVVFIVIAVATVLPRDRAAAHAMGVERPRRGLAMKSRRTGSVSRSPGSGSWRTWRLPH